MPIKHQKQKKYKGQNRPSEIRFTGVPPIMPIKTQIKTIKKGKTDPLKYVYQGSPYNAYKTPKQKKYKGQYRP